MQMASKKIWTCFFFILALIPVLSYSQVLPDSLPFSSSPAVKQHNNFIGVDIGLQYVFNNDPLASPFYYHHFALQPGISFEHFGKKSRQIAGVYFMATRLRSIISGKLGEDSHTAQFVSFKANYQYVHLITSMINNQLSLFGGVGADLIFSFRNYNYGRGIAEETIAEPFTTLCLAVDLRYDLSTCSILGFNSSFGGFLNFSYRNPYSVATTEVASVATYHSFAGAYFKLGNVSSLSQLLYNNSQFYYSVSLSARWQIKAAYHFTYYTFYHPRKSQTFINQLSGTLFYKF